MEIEQHVSAMTEIVRKQGLQIMVLELTVRALIGTHQDRELLRGVMAHLFARRDQKILDEGFDSGQTPEAARRFSEDFSKAYEQFLQAAASPRKEP